MFEVIETTLFYIIRLFSSALEMLFAFLMMNAFFDERYRSRIPRIAAFVISAGALLALQETGNGGQIKTLVEMLLIFTISLTVYEGKVKIKVIFCAMFSLCLALSEMLSSFMFMQFINKIPGIHTDSFFYRILSIELSNIFMLVFILLISMFTKSKKKSISFRYWLLLLTVPVTTLVTLTVYQYYIDQLKPGEEINAYIIISSIGLVFINILVFALFSKLHNQMEMQRKNDLLDTQMRLEEESFKKLEESYNHTRELRHDLKNHILSLKGIAENGTKDELVDYLNKMTDAVEEATYISMSKNSAVDAVLNEKLIKAQKLKISTQFDVSPLERTKFSAMDICTIISNSLDNAIEACEKIEDINDRYIDLKINETDGNMVISVKNPSNTEPIKRAGRYVTTKEDSKNHGLGLRSIKNTVKKYGGDMLTKYENGTFTLVISMSGEKKYKG